VEAGCQILNEVKSTFFIANEDRAFLSSDKANVALAFAISNGVTGETFRT